MKRTISFTTGKGSVNHNSRKFHATNIDSERSHLNIEYFNQNIKDVYHELFDKALARYNEKQTRSDRRIDDYYEKILSGKQEKPFYEIIVQIGDKDNMGAKTEDGQLAGKILDEYMKGFQKRNPTLKVFSAHLHMDEATPHLHIDFIPYITGSKRGLETRVSLKKALEALGFKGGTRSETERNQWYAHEKEQLSELMLNYGIEWEKKGTHEKHLSVLDFKKQERSKEVEELEKKKTELQSENQSYEEINENLKGQLRELDDEVRSIQNGMEKSKKEAESARKQADKYQKRMQELAPMVKDMEHMAAKFSDNPEQVLPEAGSIESGKSYREKKAKPLMEKIVKVLRSVYASYLDVSRKFDKLQLSYNRTVEKANNLSNRFHEVYMENQQLKETLQDYECVKAVLGKEKVFDIVQMEKQRELLLKEQKRAERRKQNREAR